MIAEQSQVLATYRCSEVEGAPPSGIHGHDLTLGTGSYDAIMGGQTSLRYKSLFFEADTQFVLRGDGAHQYHFANDLTWNGGPGYYFIRNRDTIVGLQFEASGEYKNVDRFVASELRTPGSIRCFSARESSRPVDAGARR